MIGSFGVPPKRDLPDASPNRHTRGTGPNGISAFAPLQARRSHEPRWKWARRDMTNVLKSCQLHRPSQSTADGDWAATRPRLLMRWSVSSLIRASISTRPLNRCSRGPCLPTGPAQITKEPKPLPHSLLRLVQSSGRYIYAVTF